jgi:hypothetical protein
MIAGLRIRAGIGALCLLSMLAGCADQHTAITDESNFITFEHAFTDHAAAESRKRAEGLCQARKLVAVRSANTCTLEKCFTTYQCMDKDDAATYRPEPPATQR